MREILNPDAHLLAAKLCAAGSAVAFFEESGGLHVYPLMPTPRAAKARALLCAALRRAFTKM